MRARTPASGIASALLVGLALMLVPGLGSGQVMEARAMLEGSMRTFPDAPLFGGQASSHLSPSLVFVPEIFVESAGGQWILVGEGFARLDAHDSNRSHLDLRELGVGYLGDRVTGFVGFGQAFWGVTEVRHLVDIGAGPLSASVFPGAHVPE
jgi:hypothetical protein